MSASAATPAPLLASLARTRRMASIAGLAGLAACAAGFAIDRAQFFQSYLFGSLFWLGLSIGCLTAYLMHNVVGGNWGAVIRRFLEAGARTLPVMGLLFLPVLAGLPAVYEWARPEAMKDPVIAHKALYLNAGFFSVRTVFYFALWTFFAYWLSSRTRLQDRTGDQDIQDKMRRFSSPALLAMVLTSTFAFFDWAMSLEPHWFSTIYGALYLVGQVLLAFSVCIILFIRLSSSDPIRDVMSKQILHELGNLMLAFTMLWAYLSFSQLIIIWAGNLPEEISWYTRRFQHGWGVLAFALGIFHFVVPFMILLQRTVKKSPRLLYLVCVYMVVMRAVDVFWLVEPPLRPAGLSVNWMDAAAWVGVGGVFWAVFLGILKSHPLLPVHDARIEALRHRQGHPA